jgi:hypothetical protein
MNGKNMDSKRDNNNHPGQKITNHILADWRETQPENSRICGFGRGIFVLCPKKLVHCNGQIQEFIVTQVAVERTYEMNST